MRSINYQNRQAGSHNTQNRSKSAMKKATQSNNIWAPLNKFHPSTGLFVKDCN